MSALDDMNLVDDNEGIAANVEPAVAAAVGLRLMGWAARESAGTPAVATFRILNGATVAGGAGLVTVEFAANGSAGETCPEGGLDAQNGLSIEVIAGTVDVYLYHRTVT